MKHLRIGVKMFASQNSLTSMASLPTSSTLQMIKNSHASFSKFLSKSIDVLCFLIDLNFRKMNEHFSQIVLKQLVANQHFPGAIVKYLETTELKDLSGDALILLVNVFDDRTVAVASDEFTQKLIDAMPGIQEETMLDAMVSIFCVLLPHYEKKQPDNNLILKTFIGNEQFYAAKILYLANRGSMYRLDKVLQTISIMMTHPETKDGYFTENDYDVLVDLGLRELEQSNTVRARV